MGFRFRRRLRIAPGVHLNIGKTGATSVSVGQAGATVNVNEAGTRATVGLPGSGASYTTSRADANVPSDLSGPIVFVAAMLALGLTFAAVEFDWLPTWLVNMIMSSSHR